MTRYLSRERAAELDRQRRQLNAARQRAWVEIRSYPIIVAARDARRTQPTTQES